MDDRMLAAAGTPAADALRTAATQDIDTVLATVRSHANGLTSGEAAARLAETGANVLRVHRARPWPVLGRQLKSPILILLFVTAGVSLFLGESANAIIIGVILVASVGLGFVNEFRAERAADALHDQLRHTAVVVRDGIPSDVDVSEIVAGDIVHLSVGEVIPADMRLLSARNLSCDEGIVTGESFPAAKSMAPAEADPEIGALTSCVLMGTVVQSGSGAAVVMATGADTEFGKIAIGLSAQQPQTEFQRGLGRFSVLLLEVALILCTAIFVANVLLQRPVLDSLLFSLAIAVGITPQLLPAIVSASLATGSRELAERRVLVKRLVCIEDLGDMDILVTDKTGTLTEGRISFTTALPVGPAAAADRVLLLGLLSTETDYQNDRDRLSECARKGHRPERAGRGPLARRASAGSPPRPVSANRHRAVRP
ncbi:HAD-IC family P-type ATPase [Microbacterium rhizomatis]|uniref:HAD-IC family P-type ATPase n=1 Tax=Microbacterium rhizomatis TaxID=1631477 RepID=UPI001FE70E0A|nr:HAD-IC family P-type ATPase [Microbacterium rhizomatis]